MVERVDEQVGQPKRSQAVHQIAPGARQPNNRRGEQQRQDLQTHQCGALEPGEVQRQHPIEEWNAPEQNDVACAGALRGQQDVAADQEQEQPFQSPDRAYDFADRKPKTQQNDDLKRQQRRNDQPSRRPRRRKRRHHERYRGDRKQIEHLQHRECRGAVMVRHSRHAIFSATFSRFVGESCCPIRAASRRSNAAGRPWNFCSPARRATTRCAPSDKLAWTNDPPSRPAVGNAKRTCGSCSNTHGRTRSVVAA